MEIIVYGIVFGLLALYLCLKELGNIIQKLKSGKVQKLLGPGKSIAFLGKLSFEDKKNEVCDLNTNSEKNDLD